MTEWHEVVYSREENWQRYEIQQRTWRFGRGEDTPADNRAAYLEERLRKRDERYQQGRDYDW